MTTLLPQHRINHYQRDQLHFEVIDTGPLDGQPIVLLHGFPETAQSWHKVSEILNQHNFRTFAIQQRGYSLAASPRGRFAYRTHELVEDVLSLIKILNQPVYLIGHDWGAVIAGELAKQYPQYLKHLTLISVPHSGAFVKACLKGHQLVKSYYMGVFQLPVLPELFFKKASRFSELFLKNSGMDQEQIANFRRDFVEQKRIGTALNWYRGMLLSSSRNLFKKINVPTLYIWGDQDIALTSTSARFNKEFFSGPYDEYFIKATHWIPHQNPDRVAEYFLDSTAKL